jgi:hypothetical protein
MTTDNNISQGLDNIPHTVNINITCQSGSSVILTNNLNRTDQEIFDDIYSITQPQTQTQTQTQAQTQTQNQPQTTQNIQHTPIDTHVPPGLMPSTSNSRVFFSVNQIPNTNSNNGTTTQNINNITQNLLNSLFSGTTTETVSFIPTTQTLHQMQPPNDGLSLNDLRNYTTLRTHTESQNNNEIKCEICHDNINNGEILRMINICNHSFHQECVDSWFENNKICPYCRCDVTNEVADELIANNPDNNQDNSDNSTDNNAT